MTIPPKTVSALAVTFTVLCLAMSATLWSTQPEKLGTWAVSAGFLPAAWIAVLLTNRTRVMQAAGHRPQNAMIGAIALAGALLTLSLGSRLAEMHELVGADFPKRLIGMANGVVLILIGNAMPKKLTPLANMQVNPAKTQALQRFMGWLFVLAGALYATVWMFVDLEQTSFFTLLTFPAALLLILVARVLYLQAAAPRNNSEPSA